MHIDLWRLWTHLCVRGWQVLRDCVVDQCVTCHTHNVSYHTPMTTGMSSQGPQHVVVAVKFGFAFLFISFLPWIKASFCSPIGNFNWHSLHLREWFDTNVYLTVLLWICLYSYKQKTKTKEDGEHFRRCLQRLRVWYFGCCLPVPRQHSLCCKSDILLRNPRSFSNFCSVCANGNVTVYQG